MKRRTIIIATVLAAGIAAAGYAVAQSMPSHKGHGMGMHGGMQDMHGKMQGMPGGHGNGHGAGRGGHDGHGGGHGGGHGASAPQGDRSVSSIAYAAVNEKMHVDMAIEFTGDADVDFARGMIPHHQGAVDMAKIVIAFGQDPEIRKLAEEIVKSQEAEIAFMQAWLKKKSQ